MNFKLFSRRKAELAGEVKDVFEYNLIPVSFRNQVVHVLSAAIENLSSRYNLYDSIEKGFSKHMGVLSLGRPGNSIENVMNYIIQSKTDQCLDIIDYILHLYWETYNSYSYENVGSRTINEINYWFKYNSLGYEFINGELIRINDMHIHQEVVIPSFFLLSDKRFSGADDEMRKAYAFRRKGDNKSAIIEACKAFESTMKSICSIKKLNVDPRATASHLIKTLKDNSYFPSYLDSHIDGIRITLESGLPTTRNKIAGHGQGEEVVSVPDEFVDYALNLLATNIVFLVKLLNP